MTYSKLSLPRRFALPFLVVMLLLSYLLFIPHAASISSQGHHLGALTLSSKGKHFLRQFQGAAPNNATCAAQQIVCYSPQEIQNAYSVTPVLNAGYNGKGQTIVIIDSFGSPTAAADLAKFDADYNLPAPPSFKILSPLGTVPFDPNNNDQVGWAEETSLDVQWAHALAPGASIVLMTSPVSETEGVQGMPQFLQLEQYALANHLGNIISQSWGATEETLFTPDGKKVLNDFNTFYQYAALQNVTVFASAGDGGSVNQDVNGNNYPFPTVIFPASSPWVTAVGGTKLSADTNGNYQSEVTWNEGLGDATGGGISKYFPEPLYQLLSLDKDKTLLNGKRAIPDIAYNADPQSAVPVYLGFETTPGYYLFGGTSEGSPQWAGLIADANQKAGHPVGFLNAKLYSLGYLQTLGKVQDFHDITQGNNAQGSVPGYDAGPGWDAVTGWGSPIASRLFADLH